MQKIQHHLVISILGNHAFIALELAKLALQCGCNIKTLAATTLGQETGLLAEATGNWGAIAKLEATLPNLEKKMNVKMLAYRTEALIYDEKLITYMLHFTGIDKEGIATGILEFLYTQGVLIEEISLNTYETHTHTILLEIEIKINIKENISIAYFRENILNYCDNVNLDILMEPFKQ